MVLCICLFWTQLVNHSCLQLSRSLQVCLSSLCFARFSPGAPFSPTVQNMCVWLVKKNAKLSAGVNASVNGCFCQCDPAINRPRALPLPNQSRDGLPPTMQYIKFFMRPTIDAPFIKSQNMAATHWHTDLIEKTEKSKQQLLKNRQPSIANNSERANYKGQWYFGC